MAVKPVHVHGEAFMLMLYACKSCRYTERIWNSRDGVTSFSCDCPICGGAMYHDNWGEDVYAPNHELLPRQRFWRDGTPDEAEVIVRQRIRMAERSEFIKITPEIAEGMIAEARDDSKGEFGKGWPKLAVKV